MVGMGHLKLEVVLRHVTRNPEHEDHPQPYTRISVRSGRPCLSASQKEEQGPLRGMQYRSSSVAQMERKLGSKATHSETVGQGCRSPPKGFRRRLGRRLILIRGYIH